MTHHLQLHIGAWARDMPLKKHCVSWANMAIWFYSVAYSKWWQKVRVQYRTCAVSGANGLWSIMGNWPNWQADMDPGSPHELWFLQTFAYTAQHLTHGHLCANAVEFQLAPTKHVAENMETEMVSFRWAHTCFSIIFFEKTIMLSFFGHGKESNV